LKRGELQADIKALRFCSGAKISLKQRLAGSTWMALNAFPCPDLNGDKVIDHNDVLKFVDRWAAYDADQNSDGRQTIKDYQIFQSLFVAATFGSLKSCTDQGIGAPKNPGVVPPTPQVTPTPGQIVPIGAPPGAVCPVPWSADGLFANECLDGCGVEPLSAPTVSLQEVGPFEFYPLDGWLINGMGFYIISTGAGEQVSLSVKRSQHWNSHRAVVRVFNPDERVVYWRKQEQAKNVSGQPTPSLVVTTSDTEPDLPQTFKLTKPGVYQIKVSANHNAIINLKMTPGTQWGLSTENGPLRGDLWPNRPQTLYAWMPSHPKVVNQLALVQPHADLKIFRQSDGAAIPLSALKMAPGHSDGGEIWRFELPASGAKYFRNASGVPLILSPSIAGASTIKASLHTVPDGPLAGYQLAHRFQVELARLLPQVLTMVKATTQSVANLSVVTNSTCKSVGNLDDIYKYGNLIDFNYTPGIFTTAVWALGSNAATGIPHQIVDPDHPWLGAVGLHRLGKQACSSSSPCLNNSSCVAGWCSEPFNSSLDRWDVQRAMTYKLAHTSDPDDFEPLKVGISVRNTLTTALSFAATEETTCNSLRHSLVGEATRDELIARAALAFMVDMMRIPESDIIFGNGAETSPFSAFIGFPLAQVLAPDFAEVMLALKNAWPNQAECGTQLSELVRRSLAVGVRRVFDRHYPDHLNSTGNQYAHALLAFRLFADGLDGLPNDEFYAKVSDSVGELFLDHQKPAGYWNESAGPDASYIGITHNLLSEYMQRSLNRGEHGQAVQAAMDASYTLFNHTVAGEKIGGLLGAFNFNHRIATGFEREQWGGAKGLADNIPSTSLMGKLLYGAATPGQQDLIGAANTFAQNVKNDHAAAGGGIDLYRYLNSAQRSDDIVFPYTESSFKRKMGEEFIFIKKPSYYTSVYVGKPSPDVDSETRESIRIPNPAKEDIDPNQDPTNLASISAYQNTPLTGGGLSMFWTPGFRNSLLAGSWSPLVHHGLVASMLGKRYWEDYQKTAFNWIPDSSFLQVTGELESSSITYTRNYLFFDNKIDVYLSLSSIAGWSGESLFENIPLTTCTRTECNPNTGPRNKKRLGSTIVNLSNQAISGAQNLSGFRIVDSEGDSVKFQFDGNRNVFVAPHGLRENYYNSELQIGRVQIQLPSNIPAGGTVQLMYSIIPE